MTDLEETTTHNAALLNARLSEELSELVEFSKRHFTVAEWLEISQTKIARWLDIRHEFIARFACENAATLVNAQMEQIFDNFVTHELVLRTEPELDLAQIVGWPDAWNQSTDRVIMMRMESSQLHIGDINSCLVAHVVPIRVMNEYGPVLAMERICVGKPTRHQFFGFHEVFRLRMHADGWHYQNKVARDAIPATPWAPDEQYVYTYHCAVPMEDISVPYVLK